MDPADVSASFEGDQPMPTAHFSAETTLSPAEVLAYLTDFGPKRAERWPMVDSSMYEVHDQGDGWAEVTEGNKQGWERERYTWDADTNTITIETLDSNLWGPGSGWRYQLIPSGTGTKVHASLTRHAKSIKGHLVAALIPIAGSRVLSKQLGSVLRKAESS